MPASPLADFGVKQQHSGVHLANDVVCKFNAAWQMDVRRQRFSNPVRSNACVLPSAEAAKTVQLSTK